MLTKNYLKLVALFLIGIFLASFVSSTKIVEYNSNINTRNYNLEYDANGNLIQNKDYYYEYNDSNHISKVRKGNSNGKLVEEYFYDYNGNRVKKIEYTDEGNIITYYIGDKYVREIKNGEVKDTVYYYLDNVLVGRKDSNGEKFFYHPDHIGSTSLITDSNSNLVEETTYLPFGDVLEGGDDRYLFTGKEKDETGLYYYGARYYDSFLRRFIQPDKIIQDIYDPQNLNRYSYVLNNPYKYTDSTGNYIETALDIVSLTWSLNDLRQNSRSIVNWVALGADIVTLTLPGVFAGGAIVKSGKFMDIYRSMGKEPVIKFKIKELYTSHPVRNAQGLFEKSKFTAHTDIKNPIEVIGVRGKDIVAHGHGRTARNIVLGKKTVLGRYIYNSNEYKGMPTKGVQRMEQRWLGWAKEYGKFKIKEIKDLYKRFIRK